MDIKHSLSAYFQVLTLEEYIFIVECYSIIFYVIKTKLCHAGNYCVTSKHLYSIQSRLF